MLLRTEAIGVNFVDTRFRADPAAAASSSARCPAARPATSSARSTQVGTDVDPRLVGRRVAALAEDAYADYVVADAAWLAAVPTGSSPATPACWP